MATSAERRRLLSRYLLGVGLEIGPGHVPFPLPRYAARVRYVDRWDPVENRSLFPEIGENATFPQPDFVSDLDQDRLSMIKDESQDFVVASHILEHLANPLAVLEDIRRVLRPGGIAIVLLPDRTKTFDRSRQATPLDHIVAEYQDDVRTVDDHHIVDFLQGVGTPLAPTEARGEQFELYRRRSIHVHCWAPDEFVEVIRYSITGLGAPWILVDGFTSGDSNEFAFVLMNGHDRLTTHDAAARLDETWDLLASATARLTFVDGVKTAIRASWIFPSLAWLRSKIATR